MSLTYHLSITKKKNMQECHFDVNNISCGEKCQFKFQAYYLLAGILDKLTHDMERYNIIELCY